MDKRDYFYIPDTKREIIGDRKVITFGNEFYNKLGLTFEEEDFKKLDSFWTLEKRLELIGKIENLKHNEALIIQPNLIPAEFRDSNNFLKHGIFLKLHNYNSKTDATKSLEQYKLDNPPKSKNTKPRKAPWILRKEAIQYMKNNLGNKAIAGLEWRGVKPRDKRHRRVYLLSCILGAQLFSYSYTNNSNKDHIFVNGTFEPKFKHIKEGAYYPIKVYSRDKDFIIRTGKNIKIEKNQITIRKKDLEDYLLTITLDSIPIFQTNDPEMKDFENEKYAIIQNINHTCKCEWVEYKTIMFSDDVTRQQKGVVFCPHAIAAYYELIAYWADRHRENNNHRKPEVLKMNPFPVPRQGAHPDVTKFYRKLRGQVMIRRQTRGYFNGSQEELYALSDEGITVENKGKFLHIHGGKESTTNIKALNEGQIEILLWDYMKKYNNNAFYAKNKNLRTYNWDIPVDGVIPEDFKK